MLQNGAKFIRKRTHGFKNHMKNLGNFRQAVESPKNGNLMGYFCPKNTFLQLKPSVQKIYRPYFNYLFTKLLMSFLKPLVIFRSTTPLYFYSSNITNFDKSSPSKCKFSNSLKFTKFLMSFFKEKVRFSFKFGALFIVMRDNSSVHFWLKLSILLTKEAHESANFQTFNCSHEN